MSEQVNKEQTKGAEQENITELTDQQLAEAQGGAATRTQSDTTTGMTSEFDDIEGSSADRVSGAAQLAGQTAFRR